MSTVIEFGSRIHGCHDIFSDKDAYLLYGPNDDVSKEKKNLERKGFSVTTSSISRAQHLAARGSLFVRHVFFEGKLVKGSEDQQKYINKIWCPASSYDEEVESNIELLSLLESIPSTIEAVATVNDIIVCSTRNILIRKLANRGVFVFSWSDVISQSIRYNFIDQNDALLIRQARRIKNSYRMGVMPRLSATYLNDLEKLSQRVIDRRRNFLFGSHKRILSSPEHEKEGSYSQLRAIELLCAYYHFNAQMKKYAVIVQDPAYFSANGPNKALQRTSR